MEADAAATAKDAAMKKLLSSGMNQATADAIIMAMSEESLATSTNATAIATALKNKGIQEEVANAAAAVVAKNAEKAAEDAATTSTWAHIKAMIAEKATFLATHPVILGIVAALTALVALLTIASRGHK
jgi:hypothetical protein